MLSLANGSPIRVEGCVLGFAPRNLQSYGMARPCRRSGPAICASAPFSGEIDVEKEKSLKYRRVVYNFDLWTKHRSTERYSREMKAMLTSRIVRGLLWPLCIEGGVASFLCCYQWALEQGVLPEHMPSLAVNIQAPFGLSSFALSLLLAYRTNASYGRFDEARKFWGGVVNRSRDIVRQATSWMEGEAEEQRVRAFCRWAAALPWSMMCHLRTGEDPAVELKPLLTESELSYLLSNGHRPNTVIHMMSRLIWTSSLPLDKKFRMDENLTFFSDMLGASERILRTPIPVSYTRHTSRFMIIWLLFLPLSIYPQAGWLTIPASVIIAFVLLAIEEIGVQIEEPFSVLPLAAISNTISTNVRQHLEEELPMEQSLKAVRGSWEDLEPPTPMPAAAALANGGAPPTPTATAEAAANGAAPTPPAANEIVAAATSPSSSSSNGRLDVRNPAAASGSELPHPVQRWSPSNRFDRKLREYLEKKMKRQ